MAKGQKQFTAAAQTHQVATHGAPEAQFDVSGAFTGTIVVESSIDGGTTFGTQPILKSDGTLAQSVTAPGSYRVVLLPLNRNAVLQSRASALSAGTPTATLTTR